MDILENTALSLGKKIRQKEISVREAVKASLDQIDRQEPKIHAFLDVDEKKVYARIKEVEEGIRPAATEARWQECPLQSKTTSARRVRKPPALQRFLETSFRPTMPLL